MPPSGGPPGAIIEVLYMATRYTGVVIKSPVSLVAGEPVMTPDQAE